MGAKAKDTLPTSPPLYNCLPPMLRALPEQRPDEESVEDSGRLGFGESLKVDQNSSKFQTVLFR